MEDFGDTLEAVDCTPPSMFLDFKTKEAFEEAKRKWDWVNEKESRHFIMIVDHPKCGPSNVRAPYNVTKVRYDQQKYIAYLTAQPTDFEKVIRDGHLVVETYASMAPDPDTITKLAWDGPLQNLVSEAAEIAAVPPAVAKRVSVERSLSINRNYVGNVFRLGDAQNNCRLDCVDCGTRGRLQVKLDVKIGLFKIKRAYLEFRAINSEAKAILALSGRTQGRKSGNKEVFYFSIAGINIPGVARLGFGPAMGFGWSAQLTGDGKITWGAGLKLTPNSYTKLCLKGCTTSSNGWQISVLKHQPTITGQLDADLDIFAYVTLSAAAKIFSTGYEAGVAVKAPEFKGKFDTTVDAAGGVCNNPNYHFGLRTTMEVGGEIYAYTGRDSLHPSKRWNILKRVITFANTCVGRP